MTENEKMANTVYKLSMIGIIAIIIFGGSMAIYGYNNDIYPLDRMRGNLDAVVGTSDPVALQLHLQAIQEDLDLVMDTMPPITNEDGEIVSRNPVWIFPIETTNFLRIQSDIDTMLANVEKISTVPKDNAAYHTGMLDINSRALMIKENIMDATPYKYVSVSNIVFSTIWIAAILGIFTALKRKKNQLNEADDIGV